MITDRESEVLKKLLIKAEENTRYMIASTENIINSKDLFDKEAAANMQKRLVIDLECIKSLKEKFVKDEK